MVYIFLNVIVFIRPYVLSNNSCFHSYSADSQTKLKYGLRECSVILNRMKISLAASHTKSTQQILSCEEQLQNRALRSNYGSKFQTEGINISNSDAVEENPSSKNQKRNPETIQSIKFADKTQSRKRKRQESVPLFDLLDEKDLLNTREKNRKQPTCQVKRDSILNTAGNVKKGAARPSSHREALKKRLVEKIRKESPTNEYFVGEIILGTIPGYAPSYYKYRGRDNLYRIFRNWRNVNILIYLTKSLRDRF